MEHLFGYEDVGGADGGHEEGGNQRNPECFLLTYQIDGDSPQREDAQGLIAPSEILPDSVETVRIANLPYQQG
jgi:hypothetical protein